MEKAIFIETFNRYRLHLAVTVVLLAAAYGRIFADMVRWWYVDPNYSHGFIIPLISGYFIYQRLGELKSSPVERNATGIIVIAIGVLMLIGGYAGTEYFTMRLSLVALIAGIVLFYFGKRVFKVLALPVGYLAFMVPLPYIVYDSIAFPLKLLITKYSVAFLKAVGIIVWREGNIIMFPTIELEVADACSGIRSLVSLIALTVAFAHLSQRSLAKKIILVAASVPVAVFANGLRVVATGILTQYWGAKAAEGFFHEFAGLAVFAVAMGMVFVIALIMRRFGND